MSDIFDNKKNFKFNILEKETLDLLCTKYKNSFSKKDSNKNGRKKMPFINLLNKLKTEYIDIISEIAQEVSYITWKKKFKKPKIDGEKT